MKKKFNNCAAFFQILEHCDDVHKNKHQQHSRKRKCNLSQIFALTSSCKTSYRFCTKLVQLFCVTNFCCQQQFGFIEINLEFVLDNGRVTAIFCNSRIAPFGKFSRPKTVHCNLFDLLIRIRGLSNESVLNFLIKSVFISLLK